MNASPIFSATHRQMEMLRYIAGYQARNDGQSPSYDEIGRAIGVMSKSSVHRMMIALNERGYINHHRFANRKIEILRPPALPRDGNGEARYFIPAERLGHHGGQDA